MNKVVTSKNKREFSQYLSYILRHKPGDIGLELVDGGWVLTDELIKAINEKSGHWNIDLDTLKDVVATDSKQRYSFKEDFKFIRANQGHSVKNLNMGYVPVKAPDELYHGTSEENYSKIKDSGRILPMSRQYVHLSPDKDTAAKVGTRHGKLVIIVIDAKQMQCDGLEIYKSENGVYLTKEVDVKYIKNVLTK